jgi:anti-sigma-K factor RskA
MESGIHELTAAYALDALEPDERAAYEAHLRECESCRDELASFGDVTNGLAVAATGPEPTPELRERILQGARAEPQVVVPFEPRRRRVAPVLAAAAAVAAVLVIGLGLWARQLSGDLDDTRTALEQQRVAAAVLANPDSRSVDLAAGQGRLVVGPDGQAVLALGGLEPAPAGKTYEVWVVQGKNASPSGLFPGNSKGDLVPVDGVVRKGDVVAVTVEKAGGADAPTTKPVVASNPV